MPLVAGGHLAHLHARDLFEHEQAAGGEVLVDARRAEAREAAERLADALDVLRLELEVELPAQRVGEVLDRGRDVDDLAERRAVRGLVGEELEEAQVAIDVVLRGGTLHLDDHALSVLEHGSVHLPDRARGERLGLDAREYVLPGNAELLLHDADDLGLAHGRDAVLERGELGDGFRREQVGARGEDLAELREGRAELLERLAEPAGAGFRGVGVAPRLGEAVLPEDARDPRRAPEQPVVGRRAHELARCV